MLLIILVPFCMYYLDFFRPVNHILCHRESVFFYFKIGQKLLSKKALSIYLSILFYIIQLLVVSNIIRTSPKVIIIVIDDVFLQLLLGPLRISKERPGLHDGTESHPAVHRRVVPHYPHHLESMDEVVPVGYSYVPLDPF